MSGLLTQLTAESFPSTDPTSAPQHHLLLSGLADVIDADHPMQFVIFTTAAALVATPKTEPSPEYPLMTDVEYELTMLTVPFSWAPMIPPHLWFTSSAPVV